VIEEILRRIEGLVGELIRAVRGLERVRESAREEGRAGGAGGGREGLVYGGVRVTNLESPHPVKAQQEGSWTVAIGGQPVGVNVVNTPLAVSQSGSWTVAISGTPSVKAQQEGSWTVAIGGQPVRTRPDDVLYATISASSAGDTTVVPAVSGKRIRVVAFALVAAGTVTVKFRSGSTDITGGMRLVEAGGVAHAFDGGLFQTAVGAALVINLSVGQPVGGYVVYREV